jgi:hypothetical protein
MRINALSRWPLVSWCIRERIMETIERFWGCLLRLAIGDAVGTTVEFKPPGSGVS